MTGGDFFDYGPWDVAGYRVEIDFTRSPRLVSFRGSERLPALPRAVRESGDLAWIRLLLQAAASRRRALKEILETAMVARRALQEQDLALLAADPLGTSLLNGLVVRSGSGTVGRPDLLSNQMETALRQIVALAAPLRIPHPLELDAAGILDDWNRWLNHAHVRQSFKQIRRETYTLDDTDRADRTSSRRVAGTVVRWDQTRALLEFRGWHRVTGMGAERRYPWAKLDAHLEFRKPVSAGFPGGAVVLGRVYFLPTGQRPEDAANPGLPLTDIDPVLFSEALRDATLLAHVASRGSAGG